MIYWILLITFLFLIAINKYTIKYQVHSVKFVSGKKIYIVIATVIFVVIASLRSVNVGMDTSMYKDLFQYISNMDTLNQALSSWQRGGAEVGYVILEFIISRIANFQILLFICAIIAIVPTFVVIYKYSKNYWMSIFIFIAFGYFSFFMNGVRQSIAMGLCMIAFMLAKEKKLVRYLLVIAVATLFHTSAIIFLPVYWIIKIKFSNKFMLIYFALLLMVNVFKGRIFSFINLFSRQVYLATEDAGGIHMYIFMLLTVLLGIIYRKKLFEDDNDKDFFLMMIMATLIWPIASANAAVFRLYYYFHIFMILYVPSVIKSINNRSTRNAVIAGFLFVGCVFLQVYIVNSALKYAPYIFYWQQY